jgi:excisionase family DNA binding protein
MSERSWLTVRETAEQLGKCEEQVRRYARERRYLPYAKIGRTFRFERADIQAFLAAQRVEPEPAA